MQQHITIDDEGVVKMYQRTLVKETSVGALKDSIRASLPVDTGLMPRGTVMLVREQLYSIYVLEDQPQTRKILYRPSTPAASNPDALPIREYEVPFPWMYYVLAYKGQGLNKLYVFSAPQQITKPDDYLYVAPLPNLYEDNRVCLGDFAFDVNSTTNAKVEALMQHFWESTFNLDLSHQLRFTPTEIEDKFLREERRQANEGIHRNERTDRFEQWATFKPEDIAGLTWMKAKQLRNLISDTLTNFMRRG